jgi:predicted metal-dependent peptidase
MNLNTTHPTYKKIERAKLRLILQKQPFFGVLFGHLRPVLVEDPKQVNTMATDGRHLYYHPPFVESLTDAELMFVCAHEVLHNAFEHHIRRKDRNPKKWNRAADYVINAALKDAGMTMPAKGLFDPQYAGMTSEEVYALLDDEPGDNSPGGGDPGGCGGVIDGAPSWDEAAIEELHAEQQVLIRQAASLAKAQNAGSLPGSVPRLPQPECASMGT